MAKRTVRKKGEGSFVRPKKKGSTGPNLLDYLDCNDEFIEKVCKYLRIGSYPETAAVLAGTSRHLFKKWIRQGWRDIKSGQETVFVKLVNSVERAIDAAEHRDLSLIDKCAMGVEPEFERDKKGNLILNKAGNPIIKKMGTPPNWMAAAWKLERRRPKHWGKVEYNVDEDPSQEREDKTLKISFEKAKK